MTHSFVVIKHKKNMKIIIVNKRGDMMITKPVKKICGACNGDGKIYDCIGHEEPIDCPHCHHALLRNEIIDDYEAWLPDEEEIKEIGYHALLGPNVSELSSQVRGVMWDYSVRIAKAIAKRLRGEK